MSNHVRRGEEGFTLVEVLVATVILVSVLMTVNSLLLNALTQVAVSKRASDAAAVAQRDLENLHGVAYAAVQSASRTETLGAHTYTVDRVVTNNDPQPNMKRITVTVSWNLQGPRSYVAETIYVDVNK